MAVTGLHDKKVTEYGMSAQDSFDRTVLSLYNAALGDVTWTSAAIQIHDLVGAHGQSLTYADLGQAVDPEIVLARFFVGTRRRQDLERLYFRNYYPRDEAIPRLLGLHDGDMVYKMDLYTDEEKKTSATYNEFRRINKTQNGLFMVLDGLDGYAIAWSFGNSIERGGWGHDQIQAIQGLAPHMRQFARVRHAMANAGALGETFAELLENGRVGILQLDRHGRILEANDRARDTLLERVGLYDKEGVLAAEKQREDTELKRLLARALPPYGVQGAGGSMKITRCGARTPLVLEIHPVRGTGRDHREWQVSALVLVVDPAARPRIDPGLAAAAFGLTPTESRVAVELAAGQTVAGIADELGCVEGTVRTHLKRAYRKLGIRRQTDLVRRILSLEALRKSLR